MAISENSTPLPVARRRLFAALGLIAAAPAAIATSPAASASSPAWLPLKASPKIAMALADLRSAQDDMDGVSARLEALPDDDDDPDRLAAENALDTVGQRFRDATLDMADAHALTFADMLAKAEALRLALLDGALYQLNTPPEEQGEAHDRLAWSLARDILALVQQPAGRS